MKTIAALTMMVALGLAACAAPTTNTGQALQSVAPMGLTRLYLERHPDRADEVAAAARAVGAALDSEVPVTLTLLRARARDAVGYDDLPEVDQLLLTRLVDAVEADIAARSGVVSVDAVLSPVSRAFAERAAADIYVIALALQEEPEVAELAAELVEVEREEAGR